MKKNILLTAGGTATTWHFCEVIKEYFNDDFNIIITDTNDQIYVPASVFCNKFYKVPSVYDDNYMDAMYDILKKENIDIIVPLIDFDLFNFACDDLKLKELNIISTAPKLSTCQLLTDKKSMNSFLNKNGIYTPKIYSKDEITDDELYIVKPIKGFGSIGVEKKIGKEIKDNHFDESKYVIQELCDSDEITAEIYNGKEIKIFQRKRVATKSGVCTKMTPVHYEQIDASIKKLISIVDCPRAFCIQFMRNKNGQWCIVDCNLRIGAGTALSTKIGFQLVRALLTSLLDRDVSDLLFNIDNEVKSVLRVYKEVVIK